MFNKVIYDNVHGRIIIEDELIWKLIHTSEFQRLNRIKQLGLTYYLFPSATHTRFVHSLGVYENARRFLVKIGKQIKLEDKQIRIILIAALLHDLGHGPFSHFFEEITNVNHEQYTIDIINSNQTEINKVLKESLNEDDIEQITSIIDKKHNIKWINQLISSQVDVDRLDYLARDSLNTGMVYGKVDVDWIIEKTIIQDEELIYESDLVQSIESVLLGRTHMFSRVYHHPKSYAFGEQIKFLFEVIRSLYKSNYNFKTNLERFKVIIENKQIPIVDFVKFDDDAFMNFIFEISLEEDNKLSKIANNVLNGIVPNLFYLEDDKQDDDFKKLTQNKILNQDYSIITIKQDLYSNSIKDKTLKILKNNKVVLFSEISKLIQIEEIESNTELKIGVLI